MKYYVNEGNKFGKTFEAKDDVYAVGYAEGFAYGSDQEQDLCFWFFHFLCSFPTT